MTSTAATLKGVNLSGEQTARLKYDVPPKDILVFVPGTTDPVNSTAEQHQANKTYWYGGADDHLMAQVDKLKREYKDLHIMRDVFSWSGDNSENERNKAGERLRDVLYARKVGQKNVSEYAGWRDKAVSLHLIGHSHGGNVINAFTQAIKQHGDFPKRWKIKSITYLSTPFFSKMHQVDTSHFHPKCRIVNVFNKYDLTQRVIADYSMRQLPWMLGDVNGDPSYVAMMKGIHAIDKDGLARLKQLQSVTGWLSAAEGLQLWTAMLGVLHTVQEGMTGAISIAAKLHKHFPDVVSARSQGIVTTFARALAAWAITAHGRFKARIDAAAPMLSHKYTRGLFLDDLDIGHLFQVLNAFLAFNPATLSGQLFSLIDDLLIGQIDRFDDTKTSPKDQIKGFPIFDVPVHKYDRYNGKREAEWAKFINRLEATQRRYNSKREMVVRMDFLLQLFAQMPYENIKDGIGGLNTLDWIINDSRAVQLKALKHTLESLKHELDTRACNIVVPEDIAAKVEFMKQRGGVGYTATVSHGVSHMNLYDEVKKALAPAFDSGKNPGYQVEVRH
jgi:hypothetical protein